MSNWNAPGDPQRQQGYPPAQGWSGGMPPSPGPEGRERQWSQSGPQPWSQPGPQQWSAGASPQAPDPGSSRSSRPLLIGIALGLVVAVLIGAVLAVTKVLHFGTSSASTAAVDTRPITLPDSLGGLSSYEAAVTAKVTGSAAKPSTILASEKDRTALTQAAYQKAFGGAATTVRAYATADLMANYTVIAVRASAPGLVNGPVNNPADLGQARNQQDIETIGDQQCNVVSIEIVPSGQSVDNNKLLTAACQRTGPGLTVWAFGSGMDGPAGQAQITGLVDAAYSAVSGVK